MVVPGTSIRPKFPESGWKRRHQQERLCPRTLPTCLLGLSAQRSAATVYTNQLAASGLRQPALLTRCLEPVVVAPALMAGFFHVFKGSGRY